jgi:hypothetical protein
MVAGPSPTLTASPTVAPTQGYTIWSDFKAHEKVFATQFEADANSVSAEDAKNPDAMQILMIYAENIRADMADELTWLKNQRPEPCYQTYYDNLMVVYRRIETSMNDLIESHAYGSFVSDWSAVQALAKKYTGSDETAETACTFPQASPSKDQALIT